MKILFKYPTRQRPEWFKQTLTLWQSMLSGKHVCRFIISCDDDDESMKSPEILSFINSFDNVRQRFSPNKTKIEACNADMDEYRYWDILVLISDDMVPQVDGFDDVIVNDMLKHFPDLDGALHYPDGLHGGKTLITLSIIGKKLYDSFGYIYYPGYKSFYCDTEFTDITYKMGKCAFIDKVVVKHEWKKNNDSLYAKNQVHWDDDQKLYNKRKLMSKIQD